ncbi:MAG TPA: nuclear transport factor 2 family protein [Terriglobales bacterium]|nr:nuclear transport factor 2 family protein [Terriglobales bacterium]
MRLRFLLLLLLLLSLVAQQPAYAQATDAEIRKLTSDYERALKEKDIAALDRFWADDYTFINNRGMLLTKAERMQNVKSGATEVPEIEQTEAKVRTFGNTVLVTGRLRLKAKYSGKESSGEYRYSALWVDRNGRWQIAAHQLTPIQQ